MEKLDLKKELKHLYKPSAKEPSIIDVPAFNYLLIDGKGDPNKAQEYMDAVSALYPVAYTLKFTYKKINPEINYVVMPLEGLWWADDMSNFSVEDKDNWKWTLMIMQPDFITEKMVAEAFSQVKDKKDPVSLPLVRFESFTEGKAAQIMHLGPFSEEGPTIEKLHNYIFSTGGQLCGKHHEIYLSDIRRANPKNWKTIIRQPMSRAL